jgi:hypothetical protein
MARRSVLFGSVKLVSCTELVAIFGTVGSRQWLSLELSMRAKQGRKLLMRDLNILVTIAHVPEINVATDLIETGTIRTVSSCRALNRTCRGFPIIDSECPIRTDMDALLGTSSFSKAFPHADRARRTALGIHPPKRKS